MSAPEKPWVRSIAHHTYWNIPREIDTYYQVDTLQDADTLEALKFAVKEGPPAKAKRASAPPPEPAPAPVPAKPAAIMTTADLPTSTPSGGSLINDTKRR